MEVEMEDDVFFADLSKQIALLIMDEEEEEEVFELGFGRLRFPVQCPQLHHHHQQQQEFLFPLMPPQMMVPPLPSYTREMSFLRESSKGTGVFIPRSSNIPAKRKNKSKKSTVDLSANAHSTCNKKALRKSNKNNYHQPPK